MDKSQTSNKNQKQNLEVQIEAKTEIESLQEQKKVTTIEQLAEKMNGELKEIVHGETWDYAVITTPKAIVLVKYSPRAKNYLFTKGLIAIGIADILKVFRALERHAKSYVEQYLKSLAQKYGVEINFK